MSEMSPPCSGARLTSGCIRTMRGEDAGARLAKYDNEQARAQQHKAGRNQREESVGHEVMITHGTTSFRQAGWSEFIKDFGIGCLRGSRSQFPCFRRRPLLGARRPSGSTPTRLLAVLKMLGG